jgi:rhamnopyranosyl-N-acetylglucosaminyl-diphospho-decaprenol beta-1,3/1,4-galactofuranosyltransferase
MTSPSSNGATARPTVAAVMTSFNKREDVRKNLDAIFAQTVPFDEVIVVDNHSSDGSAEMIREGYPKVHLIVMPHDRYGACETFNLGFATSRSDFIAILDDDVVLPPDWNAKMLAKSSAEPPSTALISSHVIEPGTPQWYLDDPEVNRERYMATFRGCATLARRNVIEACGWYDADFFIYGNERDLSARVLSAGYRILQYPGVVVQHGTPFGMKTGRRSLYYHVRNLWWYLFKHVPAGQIAAFLLSQLASPFRRKRAVTADAVGTIGLWKTIRETKGGLLAVLRGTRDGFLGLPRCLRKRAPCRAPDFDLPVK